MMSLVVSDIRRLWLGSIAIVLLVAVATALVVTVTLQERALRLGSARAADRFDLIVGAAGSETQLVLSSVFLQPSPLPLMSGDVLPKLLADPRVEWASPVGFGDSFSGYPIVGTTTALIDGAGGGLAEGVLFAHEDEAVIGSAVDLPLGATIKPMHGLVGEGGHTHTELAYEVSGKLKPTGTAWDRAILVPIQAVWHIHGLGEEHEEHHEEGAAEPEGHEGHVHGEGHEAISETFTGTVPGLPAILVKPKSVADAYRLRQEYRSGDTVAVFPGEVLTALYATLGDAKRVLVAVAFGAQALVAASLLLVTVVHIGQRRRQIGALRAFGAPRGSILAIVWLELLALVATGMALGFATGFAAASALSSVFTAGSGVALPVGFAREDLALAGILLLVAALLALLPAILAYRQPAAEALRA